MNRFTWHDAHGGVYAQNIIQQDYDTATVFTGEAIDRLAAYEDIGLTPDEIKLFLVDFGISMAMENRKLKQLCSDIENRLICLLLGNKRIEEIRVEILKELKEVQA